MQQAMNLAERAAAAGEVPVGAVVVLNDKVIGEGYNQSIGMCDPSAHAEVMALRQAAKAVGNYRLNKAALYVTLEPCLMCLGAMLHARIHTVVFGAKDPKAGAICSTFRLVDHPSHTHFMQWESGVLADDCTQMLQNFFQNKRRKL